MNLFTLLLLGIVQGFTEPLPISSSGHVVIVQALLGIETPGMAFEAFVNFGSSITIIIFFRKELKKIIVDCWNYITSSQLTLTEKFNIHNAHKNEGMNLTLKIIVATIPLTIFGILVLLLNLNIGDNIKIVGFSLLITATLLFIVHKKDGTNSIFTASYKAVLFIGLFQAFALMPGLSRSGMTLVAALLIGIKKEDAFKFSFLMFIPASIGSLFFSFFAVQQNATEIQQFLLPLSLTLLVTAIFTYFGLLLTKRFVVTMKLHYFSVYCFCVGTLVILFL